MIHLALWIVSFVIVCYAAYFAFAVLLMIFMYIWAGFRWLCGE